MDKEIPSITEFRDIELAKAMLYQMARTNGMDYVVDDVSPEVMEKIAEKTHKIAVALDEFDIEHQRNYLFTITCLLMLSVEGMTENLEDI